MHEYKPFDQLYRDISNLSRSKDDFCLSQAEHIHLIDALYDLE